MGENYKKLIVQSVAECLGTMMLTFAIISAVTMPGSEYIQVIWAHGFVLLVCLFILEPISGCHLNPAVTLALMLRKRTRLPFLQAGLYIVMQFLGGFLAGALNYGIFRLNYHAITDADWENAGKFPSNLIGVMGYEPNGNDKYSCLVAEIIFTGLFILGILIATGENGPHFKDTSNNFKFLFIFAVFVLVGSFGGHVYACLNPARSLGPRLFGACIYGSKIFTGHTWIPTIGAFLGGAAAVIGDEIVRFFNNICREGFKV